MGHLHGTYEECSLSLNILKLVLLSNNCILFFFPILVYFDVDSVIPDIGVAATLEFNFGPFQGSIDAVTHLV